jgi:hypothetical protein
MSIGSTTHSEAGGIDLVRENGEIEESSGLDSSSRSVRGDCSDGDRSGSEDRRGVTDHDSSLSWDGGVAGVLVRRFSLSFEMVFGSLLATNE